MKRETVIKKANRKVERLNEFIRKSIEECGGETDLYLDNSSTIVGAPEYVEPNYNIKEDGYLYAGDTEICRALYFAYGENEWYEDNELDEMLKWERSCVRKGVRYYKEYNADMDNDNEAKFFYNL